MSTPEQRRSGASLFARVFDIDVGASEAGPVIKLCNLMLSECLLTGFTEVRLAAPEGEGAAVQYGRGNEWKDVMKLPAGGQSAVVNRFKVMANLDIAKRPEQEGTFTIRTQGRELVVAITVKVAKGGAEEVLLRFPADSPGPASAS